MLVKVAPRDYRIGTYDTSAAKRIVFEDGQQFESPKAALEAFKTYRQQAKAERDALRKTSKAQPEKAQPKTAKATATKAQPKTAAPKTTTKRVAWKPKSA